MFTNVEMHEVKGALRISTALAIGAALMLLAAGVVTLILPEPGVDCRSLNGSVPVCTQLPSPVYTAQETVRILTPFSTIDLLLIAGGALILWRRRDAVAVLQLCFALAVVLLLAGVQLHTVVPLLVAGGAILVAASVAAILSVAAGRWRRQG